MDLLLLWTIQLSPLVAFLAILLLPKALKKIAPALAILGALAAALASLRLLSLHLHDENLPVQFATRWLAIADHQLWRMAEIQNYTLVVGFLIDRLNLLMITLVTTITFFVQVFSAYYMADDRDRARYFAFLSFFAFSMTGLVLSNNLLQTFLFWELVGLTSYLLIGFWYEKPSAATAARKAFVINRLGDLGFYLGVIVLFLFLGTLNFTDLTAEALKQTLSEPVLTFLGLAVLLGVMGKSAQFPFHVWLPDAMEGPTPVSALIHSATMVAAGVFLLSRAFGLFSASETTLWAVLGVGAVTALLAGAVATVQRDIKKILAYSTVSQLGLMVMAIGAGSATGAMFHLSTHAYFKSLLFLTAGAFIHRFHTNDIWEIARGGGKKDTLAMAALGLGLFSLCGIFPFSGFFSKDLILETIKEKNLFFYGVALLVSFLTVYYSFRMLCVIVFSKMNPASHSSHSSAVSNTCRAVPLVSLAVISLIAGALGTPAGGYWILHWLGGHESHVNPELLATTSLVILAGAALAFFQFKNPETAEQKLRGQKNAWKTLLERKFFIDDAYEFAVKKVGLVIAAMLDGFDRAVINGIMVNQTAWSVLRLGRVAAKVQNGLLQDYLAIAAAIGIAVIFWMTRP